MWGLRPCLSPQGHCHQRIPRSAGLVVPFGRLRGLNTRPMKIKLKTIRRSLQILSALALIVIPYLNSRQFNFISGNLLSFQISGFTFSDPLAAFQVVAVNGHLNEQLAIALAVALGGALVFGAIFCSWICPFGLLSEMIHSVGAGFRAKTIASDSPRPFIYKGGIFLAIFMVIVATGLPPLLNQLSMPGWYSRLFQLIFLQSYYSWGLLWLGLVLALELFLGKRFWCRYVCPQALLLMLLQRISPWRLRLTYRADKCNCPPGREGCFPACSLGLKPKGASPSLSLECSNCGDCYLACQKKGQALGFNFSLR